MKKQVTALLLSSALLISLAACGGSNGAASTGGNTSAQPSQSAAQSAAPAGGDLVELTAGALEGPVLITSVGQSADVAIVNTLFTKAGVEATQSNTISAEDFDTKYQTLVLAIGGSSKGLGAAGIDENQELERVTTLIAAAQQNGTKILSMHIGGSARRGVLSDMFIPDALQAADAAIILSEGDSDNYMRDILASAGVPTQYVDGQMDVLEPLQSLFGE